VADPAIVQTKESVLVMGTGDVFRYKKLDDLIEGKSPEKEPLTLYKEVTLNGQALILPLAPGELPWDLQFYEISGTTYLYGGVMSPLPNLPDARWPEENISRRIKVATFHSELNGWVFKERPVFGEIDHTHWKGHSYGQQIVRQNGEIFMLHEEITRDGITEIYIRKMLSPFEASAGKKIIGTEDLAPEKTLRVDGGHLLEGPRYGKISVDGKTVHLIFFSTGDFPTKNYATRVAYSLTSIEGPYRVVADEKGAIDLTQVIHKDGLYGVGRAFPFTHKDENWIIFHGAKDIPGVDHTKWPETLDHFQRCLFASKMKLSLSEDQKLRIELEL
jgi:hypothetical protein